MHERLRCLWLGDDGYVSCSDNRHLSGYFTEGELIEMKNAIDRTLNYYKKEGITDDFISHQDEEERKKELELWNEKKNVTKREKVDDLYLILDEDENHLKIGRSKNVKARLNQLQIATSHKLSIVYIVPKKGYMEKDLHDVFVNIKIKGEWFKNDGSIIDYFNAFLL